MTDQRRASAAERWAVGLCVVLLALGFLVVASVLNPFGIVFGIIGTLIFIVALVRFIWWTVTK
jgi:hypothetical protein